MISIHGKVAKITTEIMIGGLCRVVLDSHHDSNNKDEETEEKETGEEISVIVVRHQETTITTTDTTEIARKRYSEKMEKTRLLDRSI
jgi:hypothetical protein